jgi:hypothetical protein
VKIGLINKLKTKTNSMPYFDQQIDVDEFLYGCSKSEIQEVIDTLIESGNLPKSVKQINQSENSGASASEMQYEEALDKLHGKWNMLSSDEEQTIINISKRF